MSAAATDGQATPGAVEENAPLDSENTKQEEVSEHGEDNKFQQAVAAWRSTFSGSKHKRAHLIETRPRSDQPGVEP